MERVEFGAIIAYLEAAAGKPMAPETARVYFDLLGDLPADVLLVAAKRAILESPYPTIPPVGTLRRLALEVQRPDRLAPMEAWSLCAKAIRRFGYCREAQGLASLPPDVRQAAECLGWQSLCDSTEEGVVRGQFCKAYEQLQKRAESMALLPEKVRHQLEAVWECVKAIGQMPDETRTRSHQIAQEATPGALNGEDRRSA
jgi:hypothetical protein